jgi:alpha-1,2-mannosyltransferase
MSVVEHAGEDVAPERASRGRSFTSPRNGVALAIAIVVLVVESAVYYHLVRNQSGGFSDLFGRATNFQQLKSTGNIYTSFSIEAFTYPPGGILLLSPLVLIPTKWLAQVWTFAILVALTSTLYLVICRLTRHTSSSALLIAVAITVISPIALSSVYDNIFWGQIGAFLTLAIVADVLVMKAPAQGVWVGLATALKIYPGIFIVIWLVRRQFRQAITALATVAVVTLAATLLFYQSATTFFRDEIVGSQELEHFATYSTAQASSSIDDVFLRPPYFLGHLSASGSLAIAGVFAVIGVIAAYGAWLRGHEFTSMVIGLVISTICSPIAWNHYFAFVPLLAFLPFEIGWRSWTTRFALLALVVNVVPWPRWKDVGVVQVLLPRNQLYLSYVSQNATMVAMLLVMLVAAWEFWPDSLSLRRFRSRRLLHSS